MNPLLLAPYSRASPPLNLPPHHPSPSPHRHQPISILVYTPLPSLPFPPLWYTHRPAPPPPLPALTALSCVSPHRLDIGRRVGARADPQPDPRPERRELLASASVMVSDVRDRPTGLAVPLAGLRRRHPRHPGRRHPAPALKVRVSFLCCGGAAHRKVQAARTPFRRDLARRGAALKSGSRGLPLRASIYHGVTLPVRRHLTLKPKPAVASVMAALRTHQEGGASPRGATPPQHSLLY